MLLGLVFAAFSIEIRPDTLITGLSVLMAYLVNSALYICPVGRVVVEHKRQPDDKEQDT